MERVLENDPAQLMLVTAMMEADGLLEVVGTNDGGRFLWNLTEAGSRFAEKHGIELEDVTGRQIVMRVGLVYAEGELEKVSAAREEKLRELRELRERLGG